MPLPSVITNFTTIPEPHGVDRSAGSSRAIQTPDSKTMCDQVKTGEKILPNKPRGQRLREQEPLKPTNWK